MFLTVFSFLFGKYSPVFASTNHVDENNLKQGHRIYTNKIKKLPNYKESQIVEEGDYINNKKTGKWLFYHANDKVKHILTYTDNRPDGYAIFYYQNGKKREEGIWKNNKWVGDYKYYYKNGNIRNEWKYNSNGQRTGFQKYYFENGQLMIEGEWVNGKEAGIITEYHQDGSVKSERVFMNGKINLAATNNYKPQEKQGKVTVKKVQTPLVLINDNESKSDTASYFKTDSNPIKKNTSPWNGTGDHQFFNKNGQVVREGYFVKGYLMDGSIYLYNRSGIKAKTTTYMGGRVVKEVQHKKL